MASLTIDCGTCTARGTDACTDCVVTFLCDRAPGAALVLEPQEQHALRLLGGGGLVPPLRHARAEARAVAVGRQPHLGLVPAERSA